jgi:hypothetical protein
MDRPHASFCNASQYRVALGHVGLRVC